MRDIDYTIYMKDRPLSYGWKIIRLCYFNIMEMKLKENDRNLIKMYMSINHQEKLFRKVEQNILKGEDMVKVSSNFNSLIWV